MVHCNGINELQQVDMQYITTDDASSLPPIQKKEANLSIDVTRRRRVG